MRVLAAALVVVAAVSPANAQAPRIEPVLVELKLGRFAQRTIPAHRSGEDALIPLSSFFELAELRVQRDSQSLTAVVQPGNRRFEVTAVDRTLSLEGRKSALTPREIMVQDGEIFLSTRVIGEALGLRWEISWADLEVIAVDPEDLPIGRRLRREQMASARLSGRPDSAIADGRLTESTWPLEGIVADYSVLVPTNPGPEGGAYSGTLGFTLFGGSLVAGVQNQGPVDDGNVRLDLSWTGVWRDNPYLSQLRVGDGFSSGPRPVPCVESHSATSPSAARRYWASCRSPRPLAPVGKWRRTAAAG